MINLIDKSKKFQDEKDKQSEKNKKKKKIIKY